MAEEIKARLYQLCEEYINQRIETSRRAITEIQTSANEETKSSAGDKYETGRAMAQLEVEKNSHQLAEAMKLKHALAQIHVDQKPSCVQPGAFVITDRAALFIAISLGKVLMEGKTYLVIGANAPLAIQLMGSKVGDTRIFNDQSYTVKELL